uniref:Uncharacterized protein n=1 Tax=Caenorhabditis tropicalis TaxID=1561998 RepID=A0A1I7U146_9PELO
MNSFEQRDRDWQRQIFEERLHRQREEAERQRHKETIEKLTSTEKNYTTKIEAVDQEMGEMAKHILILMNNKKRLENTIESFEKKFHSMQQKLEKFDQFMIEEKTRAEVNEVLKTENHQLKEQLIQMQQQMTRMENDIKNRNENWESNLEWVQLHRKVLEFVEEIKKKEETLPELGQNNSEDLEMQKFVNFVLYSAEKLERATCRDVVEQTGPADSTSLITEGKKNNKKKTLSFQSLIKVLNYSYFLYFLIENNSSNVTISD